MAIRLYKCFSVLFTSAAFTSILWCSCVQCYSRPTHQIHACYTVKYTFHLTGRVSGLMQMIALGNKATLSMKSKHSLLKTTERRLCWVAERPVSLTWLGLVPAPQLVTGVELVLEPSSNVVTITSLISSGASQTSSTCNTSPASNTAGVCILKSSPTEPNLVPLLTYCSFFPSSISDCYCVYVTSLTLARSAAQPFALSVFI